VNALPPETSQGFNLERKMDRTGGNRENGGEMSYEHATIPSKIGAKWVSISDANE
jgi:hypothetical protein